MKGFLLIALLLTGLTFTMHAQISSGATARPKAATTKTTNNATSGQKGVHMKFDTELIDLGKVKKGEKRSFKYNFVNSGSETIDFQIVSGCDCTKTDWPRSPVKPGQKGVIDVTFDSTEKEKSETVDVDIYLENKDPQTNRSIFKRVKYKFELVN
jgi:peptidoglycan-associated lipoprotein